ncbi:MAG: ankyrin repeat domain-containing protein [Pseudomonadota bacterium]
MAPSLDDLRRQAKRLKRAVAAGETDALMRAGTLFPNRETLGHVDALHVIAHEHGYESWPKLKFAAERRAMDREQRAERLKVALYLGQSWMVEDLLGDDPGLGSANFGLQCALYDFDGVRAVLTADPANATRVVGVRSPILHLAFSRRLRSAPEREAAMIAVAEALVAAGADVNDSYPAEPGSEHRLSALYGALGHAGNLPLAAWLLDHGASPDDNESLYHATELGHLEGIKLLMRHGVRTRGTNALARMLDFDDLDGARLLLDYGADPNEAVLDHPSGQPIDTIPALHQAARRGRDGRFATLLLQHGADGHALWQGHSAYALARIYGNAAFADALTTAGNALPLSETETILAACADGHRSPGRRLDGLPLSPEERRILARVILHEDRLRHAQALVAVGIDPSTTEEMGMPPLHLAGWAGLPRQVAWLLTLAPDLGHVNDYGGDIVGTIVHGSQNRLDVDERDHVTCARLALEAGAPLRRSDVVGAMNEAMAAFLDEWAETHPEQVVEDRGPH